MKKLIIFLLFLTPLAIQAQVNVRVEPAVNGQNNYEALDNTALQTLLDDATPNSTVYIYEGNCGTLTIRKPLTLIGRGYGKNGTGTYINILNLEKNSSTGTDASGTTINGFDITNIYAYQTNHTGNDNINILNNNIQNLLFKGLSNDPCTNWQIKKNRIHQLSAQGSPSSGLQNFILSNNILTSYIRYFYSNLIIENNIFSCTTPMIDCTDLTVNNNIFNGANQITCSGCAFANNISYGTTPAEFTECSNGSVCDNNSTVASTNPMFVNVPAVGAFNLTYDFHLAEGSAALTHDDGEEIGIYGGNDPFEPEIDFDFLIKDAVLNPGDNLEVIIKTNE